MQLDYTEILMTVLTVIILPGAVVIGTQVNKLIQAKIKDDKLAKYLRIASECVVDSVANVAQTYIDKLSEGEWNEGAKKEAFERARDHVVSSLGITGKHIVEEALGDFEGWLETKIEAEVKRFNSSQHNSEEE